MKAIVRSVEFEVEHGFGAQPDVLFQASGTSLSVTLMGAPKQTQRLTLRCPFKDPVAFVTSTGVKTVRLYARSSRG
jgi:hypothetical protein